MYPFYNGEYGIMVLFVNIHAKTADGKLVNIEIQLFNRYDMEKRTLYYWSKMFTAQLTEGKPYRDLRKTIAINIVNFDYIDNERFHNVFHLREDETDVVLTDLIEIHFLELPKLEQERETLNNKLVKWLLFLKGVQKERWGELSMNEPTLRKAMDTLEFLSQDREARQLYEMRQKALHDEVSMILGAKEEGRAQGRAEGRAEGKEEGREEGKEEGSRERALSVAKNLLSMGLSTEMIMQATGLTRQEIEKLNDQVH